MSDWLHTKTLGILEKGLDASALRQRVLADNVANVDTPGFKRSDVDFAAVLAEAQAAAPGELPLRATSPKHLPGAEQVQPTAAVTDSSTTLRNDGNNVDIEQEMAKVAENSLYYSGVARALSAQLAVLRMVVEEKP